MIEKERERERKRWRGREREREREREGGEKKTEIYRERKSNATAYSPPLHPTRLSKS